MNTLKNFKNIINISDTLLCCDSNYEYNLFKVTDDGDIQLINNDEYVYIDYNFNIIYVLNKSISNIDSYYYEYYDNNIPIINLVNGIIFDFNIKQLSYYDIYLYPFFHSYIYLDYNTNTPYYIFMDIDNYTFIYKMDVSFNSDYNYHGYYNYLELENNDDINIIKHLYKIKNSPVTLGDALLTKYNNEYVIYKFIFDNVSSLPKIQKIDILQEIIFYGFINENTLNTFKVSTNSLDLLNVNVDKIIEFTGIIGDSEPYDLNIINTLYYLNTSTCDIYYYYNNKFIKTYTSLYKFTFQQDTKKLLANINIDNTFSITYISDLYIGSYQGYFNNFNLNNPTNQDIINNLESIKSSNAIEGDVLLIKINNIFNICLIKYLYPIPNIIKTQLSSTYVLFYNVLNNIIIKCNNSSFSEYETFEPDNTKFIGVIGEGVPINIPGFYLDSINNDIYLNNMKTYICLYKYTFVNNNNDIFIYNDFYNNIVYIYNTLEQKFMYSGNYQGYYSDEIISNPTQQQIYNIINNINGNPKVGDLLLINNNVVYRINSLTPLNINILLTINSKLLYYNVFDEYIYLVDNNIVTKTELTFDKNNTTLIGVNGYGYPNNPSNPENRLYYLDMYSGLVYRYYQDMWILTMICISKYNYRVNPYFLIYVDYYGNEMVSTIVEYIFEESNINFEGIVLDNVFALPYNPQDNTYFTINTDDFQGNVFLHTTNNEWKNIYPAKIMYYKDVDTNENYLIYYNNTNKYFYTHNIIFKGDILDTLPNIEDYNLGDVVSIRDDGYAYELINDVDDNYKWVILCDSNYYFNQYIVNSNPNYSYYYIKSDTLYYSGYIITEESELLLIPDNSYVSLNLNTIINQGYRQFQKGDICFYENGILNRVSIEPSYTIYNKFNGKFETFNALNNVYVVDNYGSDVYYSQKEYNGYSCEVNDINDKPNVKYKINTFVLTYKDNNCKVYLKIQNDYVEMRLLNKSVFKDKLLGKIYEIVNNVIIEIKPAIKLQDAIVDKYSGDFKQSSKAIDLFESNTFLFKQTINNNTGYVLFNPQPPIDSKLISNCVDVVLDENNRWLFNSGYINDTKIITFECDYNTLLYVINKYILVNYIKSSTFSGSFDFENIGEILNEYSLINNFIYTGNEQGLFILPYTALYNITVVINYTYVGVVSKVLGNPKFKVNVNGNDIGDGLIQFVNYNKNNNNISSPLTNGGVKINLIKELNENDELMLIYELNGYQKNININNSYISIIKLN